MSSMDEDSPSVNEPLSYSEDVPYEAQLSDPREQEGTASLKKRIGQRIYLFEDSMNKKRKLADAEDTPEEEVDGEDADLPYRPNAILLQGPPIAQLPTAGIFAYATHFETRPIGLEWVDDQTCVLVFVGRNAALHAWDALCRPQLVNTASDIMEDVTPIELEDDNEAFRPAQPLPLALYPIEERINTVLGKQKSNALKETIRMRWARTTDIKERSARLKSNFYKRHGEQAGKEGLPMFSSSNKHDQALAGNKRRKQNDEEMRRQLDAELDLFLVEDESSSNPLDFQLGGTRTNKAGGLEDRLQRQEDQRRLLDYQLDCFVADGSAAAESSPDGNTNSQGRSLLERTTRTSKSVELQLPRNRSRQTRPLPRRNRRKERDDTTSRYQTDVDGRWLHNAEVTDRSQRDYDDADGFGMRAWRSEQTRQPKVRKSQEELDQELDQLWK